MFTMKRNIRIFQYFITVAILISLASCNPAAKYEKEEKASIQDYLGNNTNIKFVLQSGGLYYSETVVGTGAMPTYGDSAFVKYTGKFLDGTIFDSNVSLATLYSFIVGENIAGFDQGLILMKEGGKATLLIPSALAYGPGGRYPIQGYTPLLFDIELVRIKAGTAK
jgi:FKBP-type peptidyl-prolyl cis-trans isomerase